MSANTKARAWRARCTKSSGQGANGPTRGCCSKETCRRRYSQQAKKLRVQTGIHRRPCEFQKRPIPLVPHSRVSRHYGASRETALGSKAALGLLRPVWLFGIEHAFRQRYKLTGLERLRQVEIDPAGPSV